MLVQYVITLFVIICLSAKNVSAKQKVLLYTKTAGYRHGSIPDAVAALKKLGHEHNFDTVTTADETKFESLSWIKQFDALVFISVSGTALTSTGQVHMMQYIEQGGGYMGIHEACDALYKSPWYGRLVGAYFNYHPYIQTFTMNIETHSHPSTSFLGSTWTVYDEVYNFNSNPRDLNKTIVLTADASTFKDPGNSAHQLAIVEGAKHPIAWYKEGGLLDSAEKRAGGGVDDLSSTPKDQRGRGGEGRAFFTALGHTKACWRNDRFLQHIYGGLHWVLQSKSIRSNDASLPSTAPGSDPPSTPSSNDENDDTSDESNIDINGTLTTDTDNVNNTTKVQNALHAATSSASSNSLCTSLLYILLISLLSIISISMQ